MVVDKTVGLTVVFRDRTGENEWVMGCKAQNEVLNRYFTIGTSCLSGETIRLLDRMVHKALFRFNNDIWTYNG